MRVNRSVIVAAIVGFIVNFVLGYAASQFGVTLGPEVQGGIITFITAAIVQITPDSVKDIIDQLDDQIVMQAMRDPDSNVSSSLPPQT